MRETPTLTLLQAGLFEPSWSNFWDDETSGSYATIRVNVDHPIKFTRLAMRALAGAEKQGVVVLVASTAGIRANYLASLYTASKHAIVGFAKAMGEADVDEGVRINCILPGLVSTPLWHDREDKMKEWGKFNGRKQLQPSDIADVMVKMVESKEYEGGTYRVGVVLFLRFESFYLQPKQCCQSTPPFLWG